MPPEENYFGRIGSADTNIPLGIKCTPNHLEIMSWLQCNKETHRVSWQFNVYGRIVRFSIQSIPKVIIHEGYEVLTGEYAPLPNASEAYIRNIFHSSERMPNQDWNIHPIAYKRLILKGHCFSYEVARHLRNQDFPPLKRPPRIGQLLLSELQRNEEKKECIGTIARNAPQDVRCQDEMKIQIRYSSCDAAVWEDELRCIHARRIYLSKMKKK